MGCTLAGEEGQAFINRISVSTELTIENTEMYLLNVREGHPKLTHWQRNKYRLYHVSDNRLMVTVIKSVSLCVLTRRKLSHRVVMSSFPTADHIGRQSHHNKKMLISSTQAQECIHIIPELRSLRQEN